MILLHHHLCGFLQAGQTALDQAREHNNPAVALLLTKAPQVETQQKPPVKLELIYIGPRTTTKGVLLFIACSDSESSAWQACEEEEGEAEGRGQDSVVTQGWNASL